MIVEQLQGFSETCSAWWQGAGAFVEVALARCSQAREVSVALVLLDERFNRADEISSRLLALLAT